MPGRPADSNGAVVPFSPHATFAAVPVHHGLPFPVHSASFSWFRGNCLRLSFFCRPPNGSLSEVTDKEVGGKVVEIKVGTSVGNGELDDAHSRRIIYGSASPYALLQSRKNSLPTSLGTSLEWSPYQSDRLKCVLEYSREISSVLLDSRSSSNSEKSKKTSLNGAWELLEIFYVDKQAQTWLPERLVDWLADFGSVLPGPSTTFSRLHDFQNELSRQRFVEMSSKYWLAISSALAVGWLETAVQMLRMHGSYQADQMDNREIENGLVEAVAVMILRMPRLRAEMGKGKIGECIMDKADFVKGRDKWRKQITLLECSSFWCQCDNGETREGLRCLLRIMLGDMDALVEGTGNWIELFISHLLYASPLTAGLESMHGIAVRCRRSWMSVSTKFDGFICRILEDNTEALLEECSQVFGPWMAVHAIELVRLKEEEEEGVSVGEVHRLVYAQSLSSHTLTWQIAPVYLASCVNHGMYLLEILLLQQNKGAALKSAEICRLYELDGIRSVILRIAGVHEWKHGRKGAALFWLQQSQDHNSALLLNRVTQKLMPLSHRSSNVLQALASTCSALNFLRDYTHLNRLILNEGNSADAPRQAAVYLISIMRNPSTPQRLWHRILYDSLRLIEWPGSTPLIGAPETHLLISRLEEGQHPPHEEEMEEEEEKLPPHALSSIRLALAKNLARAFSAF